MQTQRGVNMLFKKTCYKFIIWSFCLFILLSACFFAVNFKSSAQAQEVEVWGEGEVGKIAMEGTGLIERDPRIIIANIIKIFLGFLGVIALILILYSGYLWMTAGGNMERIEQAKSTMKNAVIGLIIILTSYAIVSFIFSQFLTGGSGSSIDSTPNSSPSFGSIGDSIVESHYPARNEKDVPRNTKIVITFREEMDLETIISDKQEGVVCGGEGMKCGNLQFNNIRIYPTNISDSCIFEDGEYINCELNNVVDVFVATADDKNFIFKPGRYLGNSESEIWYSVYLTNELKKANGDSAFGIGGGYDWTFEVSTKLDLTPPKIKGIFPFPDDLMDTQNDVAAESGEWTLSISGQLQTAVESKITSIDRTDGGANEADVETTGKYTGSEDGVYNIVISADTNFATVSFNDTASINKTFIDDSIDLGYGVSFALIAGGFEAGNSWNVHAVSEKTADYLSIDNKKYIFGADINGGQSFAETAANIAVVINDDSDSLVTAVNAGDSIVLTGKQGGADVSIISSSENISIENIKVPVEKDSSAAINGFADWPINSVIQINFNEAIDPLPVNNYIQVSIIEGENTMSIPGNFLFSNQYKTIEFRPDNDCGTNACGETIYCLPSLKNIKILVHPGILAQCAEDKDCADGSYSCDADTSICQKDGINYPASEFNSGIVDMRDNSLDGNKNDNGQGPESQSGNPPYNENNKSPEDGDDYQWSFWTNAVKKMAAPEIIEREPSQNEGNVGLTAPLTALFDDLLMSSSLKTGSVIIEEKAHNRILLKSNSSNPVGYWVEKENLDIAAVDGWPDQTKVFIEHDPFDKENSYSGDIGSGVKDIYQNCYNPSIGPCDDDSLGCSCGVGGCF